MPIYEYLCDKCRNRFELIGTYHELGMTANCPKCKSKANKVITSFACKTGGYIQSAREPFGTNTFELSQSKKQKIDSRTVIISVAFMLFILLLVTLLMPRNNIVGIFLQTLAGLIFVIEQVWDKIFPKEFSSKLPSFFEQESFRQRLPIIAIPVTTAVALIIYFKNSGIHRQWFDVFFSMCLAVGFANIFYLMLLTSMPSWVQKKRNRKSQVPDDKPLNHPLRSNWILLMTSTVILIVGSLLIFPLLKIHLINSIISSLPVLLYTSLLAIIAYGWLLSIIYLISYGLLKLGYSISRIRLKISESDKIFIRHMIWAFLFLFWLWGGMLLILNTK